MKWRESRRTVSWCWMGWTWSLPEPYIGRPPPPFLVGSAGPQLRGGAPRRTLFLLRRKCSQPLLSHRFVHPPPLLFLERISLLYFLLKVSRTPHWTRFRIHPKDVCTFMVIIRSVRAVYLCLFFADLQGVVALDIVTGRI